METKQLLALLRDAFQGKADSATASAGNALYDSEGSNSRYYQQYSTEASVFESVVECFNEVLEQL